MKLKIIVVVFIFLLVFVGNVLAAEEYSPFPVADNAAIKRAIFNEMRPMETVNTIDGTQVTGIHFGSLLKTSANAQKPWIYVEPYGSMGFEYSKMRWNSGELIKTGADASVGKIDKNLSLFSLVYSDALGEGVDIKIIQDNYRWQKIVEIESFASLGKIPVRAEYLEISFEVSGDFVLPDGVINNPISFGNNSFLQPVRAWDYLDDIDNQSGAIGTVNKNVVTKRIPVKWLKSAIYPVQTDLTITYGAENVFNSAITTYVSVAALDSTHFVVGYRDSGNSDYGTAIVGAVSGTTISSYGAENVFNSATTDYISVAVLDSTHFVVGYRDSGNSEYGTAIVGAVSGTTISSYGAENVFNSAITNYISVATFDSTHFVVGYRDSGNLNYGTAIVGEVSGTAISSYGAENVFNSASTNYISVATLDSTHFVVGYRDYGNLNYGTAIVGEVSGTTISSYGAENVFNSDTALHISVAVLDSTHFVVGYRDYGNLEYGTVIIGEVSGTTISSYGAKNVFNSAITNYISVATFDSTHFVVGYRDSGNSDYGTAIVGEVSGTTISSYGAENVFNSAITNYVSVAALGSTHFVVGYQDSGNSNHGTATIGAVEIIEPSYTTISLHSTYPEKIYTNYTGTIFVNYIVESDNPLNLSSLAVLFGVNYTLGGGDMHSYLKVPSNSIADEGIYRAHNRNTTPYMNWESNDTITDGNVWQWSGGDINDFWIQNNTINSTHTWINVSGVASNVFPSMFYLNRDSMYAVPKTGYEINQHQGIILKMFDLEGLRDRNNDYYVSMYFDTLLESTTPTENIEMWYCNHTFDPTSDDPTTCSCCVKMDEWDSTRWMDHEAWQPHNNVSYAKPLIAYAGQHPEIPPDEVVYIYLASSTQTSKSYMLNATNYDPCICNITYAETETMWLYNELSDISTPLAYTPSFYATFVRDYEEFVYQIYVANDQDSLGWSGIDNTTIGLSNVPPTHCVYNYYWWDNETDYNMTGIYKNNFWVNLTYGYDPDNGDELTHTLSLYDSDYNFVAFINDSLSGNATNIDIYSDISDYNSGSYRFKIVSTDNENTTSVSWSKRFELKKYQPFLEGSYHFYDEMGDGLTDFRDSMGKYLVWGIIFFAVGLAFTLFAKIKETLIGGK